MNTIKLCLAFFVLNSSFTANAQLDGATADPVIGQPFSDYKFTDVVGYKKNSLSINDLRGKWVVLDFWNEFCASCVASFPKIDTMQRKFDRDIKVVLVGYNAPFSGNRSSAVKQVYEKIKANYKLNLTVAYDSVLYDKLEIGGVGCPYIVIIDPDGVVRYLTEHVTGKDIQAILNGSEPDLRKIKRSLGKGVQKPSGPDLIDSNFIFENIISLSFKRGYFLKPELTTDTSKTNVFEINGMSLDNLYRFAFVGETNWDSYYYPLYSTFKFFPILEIKDSSNFDRNKRFWFKLKVPDNITKREVRNILQQGLRQSFGYKATVEKRRVPCWSLVLRDTTCKSKLLTKGGSSSAVFRNNNKFLGVTLKNQPVKKILIYLAANFQLQDGQGIPFIDETGMTENIDIDIDALLSDFDDFKSALSKNGIEIKRGFREMDCIIIRDARPSNN